MQARKNRPDGATIYGCYQPAIFPISSDRRFCVGRLKVRSPDPPRSKWLDGGTDGDFGRLDISAKPERRSRMKSQRVNMAVHDIPIFVGITGKRSLNEVPKENQRLTEILQIRVDALLDRLHRKFPSTTKVLLAGGAAGADLLVVRRVLGLDGARERPDWLVNIVLPFSLDLFSEDFSDQSERHQLLEVISHPRTCVTELSPLATDLALSAGLSDQKDPRSRANSAPEWQDFRRRHYEQVGLWIADTSNILIAVMPWDERADKVGGTARIVACRRSGRPDATASEIIAASEVLSRRSELVRPPQQYVWLLDPAAEAADANLPITVLPPLVERGATAKAYGYPTSGAEHANRSEHVRESLATANMIQRLASISFPSAELETTWPVEHCPGEALEKIRIRQQATRNHTHRLSRRAFVWLSFFFVAAVLTFEVYAKFFPNSPWPLLLYVTFLGFALTLYFCAEWRKWQPDAEDSRAISELLRLQYAWWRAGLTTRVDLIHLQGADQDLGRVRDGARNAITWARLIAQGRPPRIAWSDVWQPDGLINRACERRTDWIGIQMDYFRRNERTRELQAQRINVISWVLFVASFFLALLLFLWLSSEIVRAWLRTATSAAMAAGTMKILLWLLVGPIAVGMILWIRDHFRAASRKWWSVLLTGALALVAATGLTWSLHLSGLLLGHMLPDHGGLHGEPGEMYSKYLVIVFIVLLPAVAGAMRFQAEKLAYEAEALSYREAFRWFEHADELLSQRPPGCGDETADARARDLVGRLGCLALAENEAWLKARRERPLTPVIGG
jgi:hypothetical protein